MIAEKEKAGAKSTDPLSSFCTIDLSNQSGLNQGFNIDKFARLTSTCLEGYSLGFRVFQDTMYIFSGDHAEAEKILRPAVTGSLQCAGQIRGYIREGKLTHCIEGWSPLEEDESRYANSLRYKHAVIKAALRFYVEVR